MTLTLRAKIFIIGGLIIGFLLAIFLALFLLKDKNKTNGELSLPPRNNQAENKNTGDSPYINNNNAGPQNTVIAPPAPIIQNSDEVYVKKLSALFVERFNTYSNRNDNTHIEDALVLSADNMISWLNSQKIRQEGEYRGVTTKVLAANIASLSKDKAQVTIGAEETVSQAGAPDTVKFRTGVVDLVKIGEDWKVNGFRWEE